MIATQENNMLNYIKNVLENMPSDWEGLTTHRLDIYNESLAKTQFLEHFETLYNANTYDTSALEILPTAYDYIRLGHPLSCILEWSIGQLNGLPSENVISFSSQTTPILAILRENLLDNKATQICYTQDLPDAFDAEIIRSVYGYHFELNKVDSVDSVSSFVGSTIFISQQNDISTVQGNSNIDFYIKLHPTFGSVLLVNGDKNSNYIADIQHVRRRETIAMTPVNCLAALHEIVDQAVPSQDLNVSENKDKTIKCIQEITGAPTNALVGSSGLSIQYAIMMGLVHHANENYPGKDIKFVVPTNCYGGTNDQARRVAMCISNVEIVDLAVDRENDMVESIDLVLNDIKH